MISAIVQKFFKDPVKSIWVNSRGLGKMFGDDMVLGSLDASKRSVSQATPERHMVQGLACAPSAFVFSSTFVRQRWTVFSHAFM